MGNSLSGTLSVFHPKQAFAIKMWHGKNDPDSSHLKIQKHA